MRGPKTSGGKVCSTPISLILNVESVNLYTSHNNATLFNPSPICEITCPVQSQRRLGTFNACHPGLTRSERALLSTALRFIGKAAFPEGAPALGRMTTPQRKQTWSVLHGRSRSSPRHCAF